MNSEVSTYLIALTFPAILANLYYNLSYLPLGSSNTRNKAEFKLWKSKLSLFWAKYNITEQWKLAATSKGHSINSCNNWLFSIVNSIMYFLENIIVLKVCTCLVFELFNVRTCAKCFFHFAQNYYHLNILRSFKLFYAFYQIRFHFAWQCIEIFLAVHVNGSDFIFYFSFYFCKQATAH